MKFLTCLIGSLFFFLSVLFAQPAKLINSREIIEQGSQLYDSGQYKQALLLYNQISRNDTNYVKTLLAKALSCEADSQYDASIKYCKEALALNFQKEYEPEIYNTYGNTLLDMHKYEEAIKIFDAGLSKYPAYSFLCFNKGVVYLNFDSAARAEQWFQKTLVMNPYLYSAHYQLGLAALKQGKIVQAFLSFAAYLLMYPDGKYKARSISLLSEISNSVDDILEFKKKREVSPDENYQAIEDIVLSKIALDKAYKPIINLDDPISRQIQVVFEKLEYEEQSPDFWMQYYVPFFKDVYNSGKFELFINHSFSYTNVAQIQDYNKKKKKELQNFVDYAVVYFNLIRSTQELFYKKRETVTERYFFEKGDLIGKGATANNDKTIVGPWHFYYPAGNIKGIGKFNNAGEKEGDWSFYYFSGKIKGKENYKNDKLQGEQKNYYENELLSEDVSYTNNQLDGNSISYYYSGTIKSSAKYKMGKIDGEEKQFYSNGMLLSINNYSNNIPAGTSKTFYKSGQLKQVQQYENGKLNGTLKSYYENGTVNIEGEIKNGKSEGEWKYYFSNGKIKEKRNYVNDNEEGAHEEYYDDGKISSSYFYKKGKINGDALYNDKDGKTYAKFIFDNGKITSLKYFDKAGREISSSELKNNIIDVTSYTPDGFKNMHYYFDRNGIENGPDTSFYPSGKINEINEYKNGELNGLSLAFYRNGNKKSEVNFSNGKEDGLYKGYYFSGHPESEGWFSNGQAQGFWFYYDESGTVNTKSYYLNGELSGYKEEYTPNGKKTIEQKYLNGWLQEMTQYDSTGNILVQNSFPQYTGKFLLLYPNKQKMVEANYVHGDFDGAYTVYYFDGSVESVQFYKKGTKDSIYRAFNYGGIKSVEGEFKYGMKNGEWKNYSEDGKSSYTTEYSDDQSNGTKKYYFPDGNTDFELIYKNDLRNGMAKKYESQKNLSYQILYNDDNAVSYSYLGKDGKLAPFVPIPADKGMLKSYFSNGQLSRVCNYNDGKINGPDVLYFMNGKIRSVDTTSYTMYEGLVQEYYEDGKLKSEYNYLHDNTNGICREFYPSGILKKEMNFQNGVYIGPAKYYDDKGKLIKTMVYYYGTLMLVKNEK